MRVERLARHRDPGLLKFGTNWDGNQHAYETTLDVRKA